MTVMVTRQERREVAVTMARQERGDVAVTRRQRGGDGGAGFDADVTFLAFLSISGYSNKWSFVYESAMRTNGVANRQRANRQQKIAPPGAGGGGKGGTRRKEGVSVGVHLVIEEQRQSG